MKKKTQKICSKMNHQKQNCDKWWYWNGPPIYEKYINIRNSNGPALGPKWSPLRTNISKNTIFERPKMLTKPKFDSIWPLRVRIYELCNNSTTHWWKASARVRKKRCYSRVDFIMLVLLFLNKLPERIERLCVSRVVLICFHAASSAKCQKK